MRQTGINLENVKIKNRSSILKTLNNLGPMSRKDIAHEVGLTPAAVTLLTTEMIEENILAEKGELQEERRAGRKKILVDIDYQSQWVIAVSIEMKNTYIHICDLKAKILNKIKIPTQNELPAKQFLRIIADESLALLAGMSHTQKILGMGICIPGIVSRRKGISIKAYGIWKSEVPVKELMEPWMRCPVILENNVKAFAEGELLYGAGKKDSNLLFLKWGPGVGSAIVIQNQLYEGKDNRAAEIGHYIIEPDGKPCRCGRKGCLETRVSISAMTDKVKEQFIIADTPVLHEWTGDDQNEITEEKFTQWLMNSNNEYPAALSDAPVQALLNQNIDRLARAVVNVITFMAPDYTILFGSMFENAYVEETFLKYCMSYDESYNRGSIGKSKLSSKIYHIGAVALVTKELMFEQGHSR